MLVGGGVPGRDEALPCGARAGGERDARLRDVGVLHEVRRDLESFGEACPN